jgi:hypothetical protein
LARNKDSDESSSGSSSDSESESETVKKAKKQPKKQPKKLARNKDSDESSSSSSSDSEEEIVKKTEKTVEMYTEFDNVEHRVIKAAGCQYINDIDNLDCVLRKVGYDDDANDEFDVFESVDFDVNDIQECHEHKEIYIKGVMRDTVELHYF